MQPTGDGKLTVARSFDAPVERLWRAWTESDDVRRWWGPHGFTCPVAEMDVREGGASRVAMRAPDELGGFEMACTWTYRSVVPLGRLDFVLRFTDHDHLPDGVPHEVPHELTFKNLGGGRAELTITERGYTTTEAVEQSRAGLLQTLDKMAALLEASPS